MISETDKLHFLPINTARLISSSQIVTSVSSAVKELLENSIDAGALNIHIKIENFGLDLIEIKDDGSGISGENVHKMFLPGYTSKIADFKDLDILTTYGFRGEALGALCRLGETSITTKTDRDSLAMTYIISPDGLPVTSIPSHLPKGTIVSVKNLFKALPVRKQYASSKRKMAEELKKTEAVVQSLAVIHTKLRVILYHNKSIIWQKNAVQSLKQSFMQVVGLRHAAKMEYLIEKLDDMQIEFMVPKKDVSEVETLFSTSFSHSFLFVNSRPVAYKEISKVTEEMIATHWKITDKKPLFLASLRTSPREVDVNLEPNKTKILLKNLPDVLFLVVSCLKKYYGCEYTLPKPVEEFANDMEENDAELPSKKAKLDDSFQIEDRPVKPPKDLNDLNSISSQINKNSCVLATETEVSDINDRLGKIATYTSSQVIREDIQQNLGEKIVTTEKGIKKSDQTYLNNYNVNNVTINNRSDEVISEKLISCVLPVTPNKIPALEASNNFVDNHNFNFHPDPSLNSVEKNLFKNPQNEIAASRTDKPVESEMLSTQEYFDKALSVIQQSTKKPELALLNDWSRGKMDMGDGKILQSGAALVTESPNANKSSNNFFLIGNKPMENKSKNNSLSPAVNHKRSISHEFATDTSYGNTTIFDSEMSEDVAKFNLSIESISSQMGKKELSGFTKFARITRPKIISENPNILFTEVSRLLVDRWRQLTSDEKEYYENVAKAVDEERKNHKKQMAAEPLKPVKKMQEKSKTKFVIQNRPERRQVSLTTNLGNIIRLRKKPKENSIDNSTSMKIIGNTAEGWFYLKNREIGFINHKGLEELVLHEKTISNSLLEPEIKDLEKTTNGLEDWQETLTGLEEEFNLVENCHFGSYQKNGFDPGLEKSGGDNVISAAVPAMANNLSDETHEQDEVLRITGSRAETLTLPDKATIMANIAKFATTAKLKCRHGNDIFYSIFTLPKS